jgi:hypothetical protein
VNMSEDQSVQAWVRVVERSPGGRVRMRDLQRSRAGSARTKERVAAVLSAYRLAHPGCVTTGRPAAGGPVTTWICAPSTTSSLSGKFFHTFRDEDGRRRIERQGRVLDEVQPCLYIVQWFSWVFGEESSQELVKAEDMVGWSFHDNEGQWHAAWDNSAQLKVS